MGFEWSDLRFFLAVARSGTTFAAARDLGVNQTTCARRIAALEQALDTVLFHRTPKGYALTAEGEALRPHAERTEAGALAFQRAAAAGPGSRLIRVTTSDWMADHLVQPALIAFAHRRPDVRITLEVSNSHADLVNGEADVALRGAMAPGDGDLVARKVAETPWAYYCAAGLAQPPRTVQEALNRPVALPAGDAERLFQALHPQAVIGYTSNSTAALVEAIASGRFVGALPRLVGDARPDVQVCGLVDDPAPSLWIVYPERLRSVRHVRDFVDHLSRHVAAWRRGRSAAGPPRLSAPGSPSAPRDQSEMSTSPLRPS